MIIVAGCVRVDSTERDAYLAGCHEIDRRNGLAGRFDGVVLRGAREDPVVVRITLD